MCNSFNCIWHVYRYFLNNAWKSINTTSWLRILIHKLNIVYSKNEDVVVEKKKTLTVQKIKWTQTMHVCLFVYLFNSYIVSLSRENMRRIIYSDFSCHLYTIKKQENDDRLNFKSSKTISLISLCLKSRKRLFHSKLSFVIVSHSSCYFVSDLHSLCRVRIIEWSVQTSKRSSLLSNDLKTIKFFQIELFEFYLTFEVFISYSIRARENDIQQWSRIL